MNKQPKIYLKLDSQPKNLNELLSQLFNYFTGINFKSVKTYFDENCTFLECNENRFRSIDDVLIISKTYFPEITNKEVISGLLNLVKIHNNVNYYFQSINCRHIDRPTINYQPCGRYGNFYLDYSNHGDTLYKSEYFSWSLVFKEIELNSKEEVVNYLNEVREKTNQLNNQKINKVYKLNEN